MQCISSFNKNSPLLTFNICNYSRLLLNSVTVFSTSTRFGIFHRAWLVRMCWIASKTSTWNKQFKRQKKKDDQTNLNKEGVFQRWNVFWAWFVQKIQGRDWRLPKTIEYELACCFELFQFPRVVNWNFISHTRTWNCGMQSSHINEHGNLCITAITFPSCN